MLKGFVHFCFFFHTDCCLKVALFPFGVLLAIPLLSSGITFLQHRDVQLHLSLMLHSCHAHLHTHRLTGGHIVTKRHIDILRHTQARLYTAARTLVKKDIHRHKRTHKRMHMHSQARKDKHSHTYMGARMCTRTDIHKSNTHIHT